MAKQYWFVTLVLPTESVYFNGSTILQAISRLRNWLSSKSQGNITERDACEDALLNEATTSHRIHSIE